MRKQITKIILTMLALSIIFCGAAIAQNKNEKELKFQRYTPAAFAKAIKAKQPIMIDFGADWCPPCVKMKSEVFTDASVIKASAGITLFKVDLTNDNDKIANTAAEKYNVSGIPCLVFIDKKGKEVKNARIEGYVPPKEVIKSFNIIKSNKK